MITVDKRGSEEFIVTIIEQDSSAKFNVVLDDKYYYKLTGGKTSKEELIKKSFEFLLEREPKESIFSKFNLKIITNYFGDFEEKIKL